MSILKSMFYVCVAMGISVPSARATYSIVACDAATRACGVAVQTNNLAVGASVPYAQAGIGALASQFETNPNYGPHGLALLAAGKSPQEALKQLLAEDGHFDGSGTEARQVALVGVDGRSAVHTGEEAQQAEWAGSRAGPGYSVQGNGLAGAQVVEAMEQAFLKTPGALAERLMAALLAGDRAGGQKTGRESAALLVKTTDGWPLDIDLRIDHSADPVADLRGLLNQQMARQQVVRARLAAGHGRFDEAKKLLIGAVAGAPTWPRVWLQAARVAVAIEQPDLALQYLSVAFSQNPAWTETEIGDGSFAVLGSEPLFHRWVSAAQEQQVMTDYQTLANNGSAPVDAKLKTARQLLEAGHPQEALGIIDGVNPRTLAKPAEILALRADLLANQRKYREAVEQSRAALKAEPSNDRLRRKVARLQALAAEQG